MISSLSFSRVPENKSYVKVGVSKVDITPEVPIRLSGYSGRNIPFEGVSQKLWAKALAFGDKNQLSILITVDLLGIPGNITKEVKSIITKELGVSNIQLAISASHTHSGPQIGNILSHFHKPLSPNELSEVAMYAENLVPKLVRVVLEAVMDQEPSQLFFSIGQVDFAVNRRLSINPNGPIDHSLPVLVVRSMDGNIRTILVNYACHAVTFGPENNTVHGDWVGEAQLQIESNHPEAIAMVTIGCGADMNSSPRMNTKNPEKNFEYIYNQGKKIADEVDRMLSEEGWKNLPKSPFGKLSYCTLEFSEKPDPMVLAEDALENGRTANYSNLILNRMARSEDIPMEIDYPIQVWNFGDDFSMVFLAGEVVVDYGLRLKKVLGESHVWINAYSNDMPCYIASRRVIDEGGYEALGSMVGYEKPSSLKKEVEEIIIHKVYDLLPKNIERNLYLRSGSDGIITLLAHRGKGIGPEIEYMPEWEAFGWFRSDDRVEWSFELEEGGEYEVWMEWSVSDQEAGKPYLLEVSGDSLKGFVAKTGSWEKFKNERIGQIQLESGRQKLVFRPASNFKDNEALLDLRAIVFKPVVK